MLTAEEPAVLPETPAADPPSGRPPNLSSQTSYSTEFAPLAVPFVVTPNLVGDELTIVIAGELDVATGPLLKEAQLIAQGTYQSLRYELADLDFMDSAGLRALLSPANGDVPISQISIIHPTRAVRRVLELRGLQAMIAR